MEVGNPIWNTFHDYNFHRFSTNFELFQIFTAIETSPELNCGQGVLHGAL
jgi:hypothetical protein